MVLTRNLSATAQGPSTADDEMWRHVPTGRVRVFDGTAAEVLRYCTDRMGNGDGASIATANLDFLAIARRDPDAAAILIRQDMIIADGAPVAWLARLRGARSIERLSGVDLVDGLLAQPEVPVRLLLYGSTPDTAETAAESMRMRYPAIASITTICPPFRELTPEERDADRAAIAGASPNLVLVALGFPRQESLISEYREAAPGAVWIGVGGTLDFYAGRRVRAPRLLQRMGMEWTVRLAQEPGRLWRRYLLRDIPELVRCSVEVARAGRSDKGRSEQPLN